MLGKVARVDFGTSRGQLIAHLVQIGMPFADADGCGRTDWVRNNFDTITGPW